MMTFRPTTQDRCIPGLQRQCARIRRHVGAALVDDADHADRHAHPRNLEPVRSRPIRQHRADRIIERRNLFQPLSDASNALLIKHQPVDERIRPLSLLGCSHIFGIGV